jgi:hypothetical protein
VADPVAARQQARVGRKLHRPQTLGLLQQALDPGAGVGTPAFGAGTGPGTEPRSHVQQLGPGDRARDGLRHLIEPRLDDLLTGTILLRRIEVAPLQPVEPDTELSGRPGLRLSVRLPSSWHCVEVVKLEQHVEGATVVLVVDRVADRVDPTNAPTRTPEASSADPSANTPGFHREP